MPSLSNEQREICMRFGASCLLPDVRLRSASARLSTRRNFPITSCAISPQGDTTGWYIWSGEELSTDAGFFVPLHSSI